MTYQLLPAGETQRTSLDASGVQRYSDTTRLADGGAVVTWTEYSYSENSNYSIVSQRYDADGNIVGDKVVVFWGGNRADVFSVQPTIAGLESGGYAISFKDVGTGGMYIATFNVLGQQISNQVVTLPQLVVTPNTYANVHATSSGLGYSTITELATGGFAVTWSAGYDAVIGQYGGAQTLYSAIFNARGVMTTPAFQLAPWISTVGYYAGQTNDVYGSVALNNGNYVILTMMGETTAGNDSGFQAVALQIRSSNGALVTEPFLASTTSSEYTGQPSITALANGSFVVAWVDYNESTSTLDTMWRQFAANGTALGDVEILGRYAGSPTLSAMEDGGFMIGGMGSGIYDPAFSGFAVRFDANGNQIGEIQETYTRDDDGILYITRPTEFVTLGSGTVLGTWDGSAAGGDDVLTRLYLAERIGTAGNDVMTGAVAGTAFFAGDGNDSMTGTAQADYIEGGAGNDTAFGLDGNDTLTGGDGNDMLYGGGGNDTFAPGKGTDLVDGGNGADIVQINAASTAVRVSGLPSAVIIETSTGTITLSNVESVEFTDTTLDIAAVLGLRAGIILGTGAADSLTGTSDDDMIMGLGGNDVLSGGAGNDTILSGYGNDVMRGGDGNDLLKVETGSVVSVGATQINTAENPLALPAEWNRAAFADVEAATTRPHISLNITGSDDVYEAFSFQVVAGQTWIFDVDGASFDSYLQLFDSNGSRIASADDSAITKGAGGSTSTQDAFLSYTFISNETFIIGLRSYLATGLSNADTATLNISVQGPEIADLTGQALARMDGDAGNDTLIGGSQNDTLNGGAGHDVLFGGAGNDYLYGDGLGVASVPEIANQVFRLYHATLDRDPDTTGHLNWSARIMEGQRSLSEVAASFVGSAEFQNTYGAVNNSEFVSLLYQNVLDRPADATGLANWSTRLDGGMTRADAVLGFSQSQEFAANTTTAANAYSAAHTSSVWADDVFRLYHATLDRDPDLTGFTNWTDRLGSAERSLTQVASGFVNSTEFQNTYGTLDNTEFVEQLYQNVLDRAADATGLANWSARLEGGMTRADVVLGFSQSQEFANATSAPLKDWIRAQGVDDVLDAGSGTNVLSGGRFADTFVFHADSDGTNRVLDLDAWDRVEFDGFGYADAHDARAHMTQTGADTTFIDQGVTVTFVNAQLDHLADDMFVWG